MAMCSDHFSPWTSARAQSGFAWSWLGAALATTTPVVRLRQRSRPALPPRGRRPGGRDAGGDVPRPLLGGSGQRRGVQRAHHRRRLAAQGDPHAPARGVRRGDPRAADGERSATTASSPSTGRGVGAGRPGPSPRRPGGLRRERAPGRRLGRRAGDRQPAARSAAADASPRYRSAGGRGTVALQVHLSWAPHRGGGAGDRPRPVAQQRVRAAGVLGPRAPSRRSTWCRRRDGETRYARAVDVSADLDGHRDRLAEYAALGFDEIYLHHVGQDQERFIDAFGEHVLPELRRRPDDGQADTGDLWWKNAVIYCVDVETYHDSDGDGIGDFAGLTQPHRLPRRARRDLPVADAVLPDARPRRRLRRHRPVRGRPPARHAWRPRRAPPHRQRPRHPRDRRSRRQPHLGPAPVVQGGPAEHGQPATATTTSGAPTRRRTPPTRWSSPTRRTASGPTTSAPASGTCTTSTPTSRT